MKLQIVMALGAFLIASTSFAAPVASPETRVMQLKKEIVQIAKEASRKIKYQNEFRPETRQKLEPLIAELVRITPPKTVEQELEASVGSWKNIWSDLPFTTALAAQIYQVVFPTGYYYNISRYEDKEGVYTTFLRGAYELKSDRFAIRFTKSVRDFRSLPAGTDLYRESMVAELGVYDDNLDPNNQDSLNQTFDLVTDYIDKDIRIIRGTAFDKGQVIRPLFVLVPQPLSN